MCSIIFFNLIIFVFASLLQERPLITTMAGDSKEGIWWCQFKALVKRNYLIKLRYKTMTVMVSLYYHLDRLAAFAHSVL